MTPFMQRVAEVVGVPDGPLDLDTLAPMPVTRISQKIATSTGADRHVAIRSLAEQLVCEANAIFHSGHRGDDALDLYDETHPSELAFNVTHRGRAVRVSTVFADGMAYGRLIGDGFDSELPRELDSADALPDLLIRLIVESDHAHQQTA